MSYSKTYSGAIISLIVAFSAILELDLDEGMITEIVQAIFVLSGGVLVLIERYRKGGVSALGVKK